MPSEKKWNLVMEEKALAEGGFQVVYPRGVPVLLVKKDGKVYALSNKCVHMGCPLDGGVLEDHMIKCPCHDWRYDIQTGRFLAAEEIKLKSYPLEVRDGGLYVKV